MWVTLHKIQRFSAAVQLAPPQLMSGNCPEERLCPGQSCCTLYYALLLGCIRITAKRGCNHMGQCKEFVAVLSCCASSSPFAASARELENRHKRTSCHNYAVLTHTPT